MSDCVWDENRSRPTCQARASTFPYALWRACVWNQAYQGIRRPRRRFPYALWRDCVWDTAHLRTWTLCAEEFPYALWRDCVWDPPQVGAGGSSRHEFPYALWRDCVWDSEFISAYEAGRQVSIRLVA